MALNANEFILPGFGGSDPAVGLNNLTNTITQRNAQRERLNLAQEAKRDQAGNFLSRYLDSKDYLTGTAYDPVINTNLQAALKRGAELASQGADIPQLLTELGPMMSQINDYSSKAKAVNKQADDAIKEMRASNVAGYDYAKLKDEALRAAFHKRDPKTGQDLGLNDIKDVDPSQNYIMKTLQDRPDLVTTSEGVDAFAKNYAQVKYGTDAITYNAKKQKTRSKVNVVGQGYLTPDVDEEGAITDQNGAMKELVPKYEHATDGGQQIMYDFTNPEGKAVKAPVRLLDEGIFDEAVNHKGVGDWLRGQVMSHMKEYKDATGKEIDMGSPQAHQVARAIMYDELKRRKTGGIQYLDEVNKPSGAEVNQYYNGSPYEKSKASTMGRLAAYDEMGLPIPGTEKTEKPLNPIDTIHQFFNNNEDYLKGDIENINGHDVVDVTAQFKTSFKYGHGQAETYKKVYFDPQRRVLVTEDSEGNTEDHKESELKNYLKSIAPANGVKSELVGRSFDRAGYDPKTGRYAKSGKGELINERYTSLQNDRREKATKGLEELISKGDGAGLKGLQTKDGVIAEAGETGLFSSGKYYINISGRKEPKKFKNKAELEQYLKGDQPAAPAPPATKAAAPSKGKLSKEEADILKEQGL